MTWVDIIDTAVKIGLGAAISGFIAIFSIRATAKEDWNKEKRRRKMDTIEKTATEFRKIHEHLLRTGAEYGVFLTYYPQKKFPAAMELLSTAFDMSAKIPDQIFKIRELSSIIYLVGGKRGSDLLSEYSQHMAFLHKQMKHYDDIKDFSAKTMEWRTILLDISNKHDQVRDILREYFDKV